VRTHTEIVLNKAEKGDWAGTKIYCESVANLLRISCESVANQLRISCESVANQLRISCESVANQLRISRANPVKWYSTHDKDSREARMCDTTCHAHTHSRKRIT